MGRGANGCAGDGFGRGGEGAAVGVGAFGLFGLVLLPGGTAECSVAGSMPAGTGFSGEIGCATGFGRCCFGGDGFGDVGSPFEPPAAPPAAARDAFGAAAPFAAGFSGAFDAAKPPRPVCLAGALAGEPRPRIARFSR